MWFGSRRETWRGLLVVKPGGVLLGLQFGEALRVVMLGGCLSGEAGRGRRFGWLLAGCFSYCHLPVRWLGRRVAGVSRGDAWCGGSRDEARRALVGVARGGLLFGGQSGGRPRGMVA